MRALRFVWAFLGIVGGIAGGIVLLFLWIHATMSHPLSVGWFLISPFGGILAILLVAIAALAWDWSKR
jgi:hypothetical protein